MKISRLYASFGAETRKCCDLQRPQTLTRNSWRKLLINGLIIAFDIPREISTMHFIFQCSRQHCWLFTVGADKHTCQSFCFPALRCWCFDMLFHSPRLSILPVLAEDLTEKTLLGKESREDQTDYMFIKYFHRCFWLFGKIENWQQDRSFRPHLSSTRVNAIMIINLGEDLSNKSHHGYHQQQTSRPHHWLSVVGRFGRGSRAGFVVNRHASDRTVHIRRIVISTDEIGEEIVLHQFIKVTVACWTTLGVNPGLCWIRWSRTVDKERAIVEKFWLGHAKSGAILSRASLRGIFVEIRKRDAAGCGGNTARRLLQSG